MNKWHKLLVGSLDPHVNRHIVKIEWLEVHEPIFSRVDPLGVVLPRSFVVNRREILEGEVGGHRDPPEDEEARRVQHSFVDADGHDLVESLPRGAVFLVVARQTITCTVANFHQREAGVVTEEKTRLGFAVVVGDVCRVRLYFAFLVAAIRTVLDSVAIFLHRHAVSVTSAAEFIRTTRSSIRWAIFLVFTCQTH